MNSKSICRGRIVQIFDQRGKSITLDWAELTYMGSLFIDFKKIFLAVLSIIGLCLKVLSEGTSNESYCFLGWLNETCKER